jgi:TolB protein
MSGRKKLSIIFLALIGFSILTVSISFGKVYIDINSPTLIRTPIAVAEFKDMSLPENRTREAGVDLRTVMISDLEFSGLFDIIQKDAYIEDPERAGIRAKEIDFADWRVIGSDLLIKGEYKINPSEKGCKKELKVEVSLFDVNRGKLITGQWYCSSKKQLRRVIHKFSNKVLMELTGEKGIFESKIAFSAHSSRNKEIYYSDYDGFGKTKVTANGSTNISPQWSPDGRWLLYTSFKEGLPKLYVKNPFTGREIKSPINQ